jgi:subtilisin family serine protease
MRRAVVLALAVAAVVVVAAAGGAPSADAARARPCRAVVDRGVLPPWARTGFSDPRPRMAHTVARGRGLAALIFGDPLLSPPSKTP